MTLSLASEELPAVVKLANPSGADGAVPGMAGPADGKPTPENMLQPMKAGDYVAISSDGGACRLRIVRAEPGEEGLSMPPAMLEISGLTDELLAKFNQATWHALLILDTPSKDVRASVIFTTQLARRLAGLADGIVMDMCAYRFFRSEGWPVEDRLPDFDVREHVHLHVVSDANSHWFHTHGLVKFGRPELEIYDVPSKLYGAAHMTLLDIAQYVATSALIKPGQTCGDPDKPFHARIGTKNLDHWEDVPVLELVDVDGRRKPVASGAPIALQACADSYAEKIEHRKQP